MLEERSIAGRHVLQRQDSVNLSCAQNRQNTENHQLDMMLFRDRSDKKSFDENFCLILGIYLFIQQIISLSTFYIPHWAYRLILGERGLAGKQENK